GFLKRAIGWYFDGPLSAPRPPSAELLDHVLVESSGVSFISRPRMSASPHSGFLGGPRVVRSQVTITHLQEQSS
ncbi:MAG: hypothetical protein M3256_20000, partial [Actinomycetota bacterium]|nr:hypothetical protein [Actinomycetota bacterium]